MVRLAVGMPRFSARLLAIDDCGSLRLDVGGIEAVAEGAPALVEVVFEVLDFMVLSEV